MVGLNEITYDIPVHPKHEVGWRLAFDAWGHGYATEGARAALQFAFGKLGWPEVVAFTAAINERSQRVMQRLGMLRNPDDDFDHPRVEPGSPLRRHVLYRVKRPAV
jgi:RimJ/RimL family protein N-acetyltransferase